MPLALFSHVTLLCSQRGAAHLMTSFAGLWMPAIKAAQCSGNQPQPRSVYQYK